MALNIFREWAGSRPSMADPIGRMSQVNRERSAWSRNAHVRTLAQTVREERSQLLQKAVRWIFLQWNQNDTNPKDSFVMVVSGPRGSPVCEVHFSLEGRKLFIHWVTRTHRTFKGETIYSRSLTERNLEDIEYNEIPRWEEKAIRVVLQALEHRFPVRGNIARDSRYSLRVEHRRYRVIKTFEYGGVIE